MTDIVERLRAKAHHYRDAELGYVTPAELTQAADEVERLRAELAHATEAIHCMTMSPEEVDEWLNVMRRHSAGEPLPDGWTVTPNDASRPAS